MVDCAGLGSGVILARVDSLGKRSHSDGLAQRWNELMRDDEGWDGMVQHCKGFGTQADARNGSEMPRCGEAKSRTALHRLGSAQRVAEEQWQRETKRSKGMELIRIARAERREAKASHRGE